MLVQVAHIVSAHGIKGQVHVRSFTHRPQDFISYGPLCDEDEKVYRVKIVRFIPKGLLICSIEGINDRNQAELIKGKKLFVNRSHMPEPEPGTYYHSDLIGIKVTDHSGIQLGSIKAVHNYGAGDFFDVELEDKTMATLSFSSDCEVDVERKKITISRDNLVY